MLLNNFFEILEEKQTEAESFSLITKVKLNKNHQIFQGHFPSNPVVPGVCLIQMIKEIVEKDLKKELRLVRADNVKFLNMINPEENETVIIDMTIKPSEHLIVKANVLFEEKTFLKFSGVFTTEKEESL
ncbi:MAG TPA: hypothetical protein VD908_08685 [Cytophagales bacterium]|nr:hypothetical protein [Cytophagales bacterium]